jgi:hypothetical protein
LLQYHFSLGPAVRFQVDQDFQLKKYHRLSQILPNHGTLGMAVKEVVQLLIDLLLLAVLRQQTSPQMAAIGLLVGFSGSLCMYTPYRLDMLSYVYVCIYVYIYI